MAVVALVIALVALVVSVISLLLVLTIYRELVRTTFVNRNVERPPTQAATGTYSGEQGSTTRVVNAPDQSVPTTFLGVPDLSPELLAPSLGRPPIPKGGFGTRVVTKRNQ